jgi:hypothetical protein
MLYVTDTNPYKPGKIAMDIKTKIKYYIESNLFNQLFNIDSF